MPWKKSLSTYNVIKAKLIKLCRGRKDNETKIVSDVNSWKLKNFKIYNLGGKYKVFRSRDMGRAVAVRRWTPTALDCYKRGCNCEGCFYKDFFSGSSQKCQMKASVLELVRVLGTPDVEIQQIIND